MIHLVSLVNRVKLLITQNSTLVLKYIYLDLLTHHSYFFNFIKIT